MREFYTAISAKDAFGLITLTVYRSNGDIEYIGEWYDRDAMVAFLQETFNIKYA